MHTIYNVLTVAYVLLYTHVRMLYFEAVRMCSVIVYMYVIIIDIIFRRIYLMMNQIGRCTTCA